MVLSPVVSEGMRPAYRHPPAAPRRHLHLCVSCLEPFVEVDEVLDVTDEGIWTLSLCCRNCGWSNVGECDDVAVEELEEVIDDAARSMSRAADLVSVAAFAFALDADLILPEDF